MRSESLSVTTMDKQTLLRLISVVLALTIASVQVTSAIMCYWCSNDPDSDFPFDPECGQFEYHGNTLGGYESCSIRIHDSGYISRWAGNGWDEGECNYGEDYTECFCNYDECNTDSYCAQCSYPKPTPTTDATTSNSQPPTTYATTSDSQPPTIYSTTSITSSYQPSTTDVTTASSAIMCYWCSNDSDSDLPFDPECGKFDYHGNTLGGYDNCSIILYDSGYISRWIGGNGWDGGDCYYGEDFTACFCNHDECNTESYCAQCGYPKPTPTSDATTSDSQPPTTDATSATTSNSQPPTLYSTTSITTNPQPTTTEDIITTTTEAAGNLKCYNCIDCGTEDSTPIIEDKFLSCSTIVFLNSGEVIRSGSFDEHPDGECVEHTASVSCWCTDNLCNNFTISF
ncbi:unnamed protein product [Meganyctiphanes norvegica]|uniref:Uncharacterized protein n=1 Tax=Meganyctiphanes norvegica TaxID=48144 RepID=A0AAV2S6M0_MEGNR